MSSGPKNVTSTTSNEPPGFLLGPLTQAVNAASGQFFNSGAVPGRVASPGTVPGGAGLPPGGSGGQGGKPQGGGTPTGAQPSLNPNDLIGQSQGLTGQTIRGDFLRPESNPFLADTFNRAADLTQTRLASQFAGSGRDQAAALPARSEELQTLASNIFGGNFQQERNRQVGAVDQSQALDPLNRFINQLAGIIPGAGGTTTSTQPVFRQGLFSDRRLKNNIKRIGTVKGYPWYSFDYIWGESSEGFMSDEIPQEYVMRHVTGYDMVDYGSIL